ncbi:anhydro-N-acetylmuramic acid kinase [Leptolyngbya sp. FACHB-321]|uniref:anhydro-N-acetylmuramic acid kinase n=1 Tax=Leptolyngbya sp. FACHB-321 TaxID=2692807 RepID=UPI001682EA5A|nr:anhydro-N-acetylmuramic acid kinase [Leptolyngbya sp. FACHB-321]MBD2035821.1 anhydro-N-acetylmuramic acid kinase [Leptolyngbya sp. FACHB-321]
MALVIGLMSGTSVDGIDAALVDLSDATGTLAVTLLAGATYPYPTELRAQILAVCGGASLSMADLADLDDAIAHQFAQAAIAIQTGHPTAVLIGSHGQTVYHRPPKPRRGEESAVGERAPTPYPSPLTPHSLGYSLQLGRGEAIANATGITTISNFRAADIAAGGHGAPLVPAVDVALLSHPTLNRCVQNIGGIGNVAYLPTRGQKAMGRWGDGMMEQEKLTTQNASPLPTPYPPRPLSPLGWDTGPGNVLLDLAVQTFSNGTKTYDKDGNWAASGTPCEALVDRWLQQPFFQQQPPKSTGRELFGAAYLHQCLADAEAHSLTHADILATLTALTVDSIVHSYRHFLPQLPDQVLLCGGGSKNLYLKQRLQRQLGNIPVLTTDDVGLNAEFKEAIAFAVLAYWRQQGIAGNLPEATGAQNSVLLGDIHSVYGRGA